MADHSNDPPDPGDLQGIPPERRDQVREWLATPIATCCTCGFPVYPISPRGLDGKSKELGHLDCLSESLGKCEICRKPVRGLDDREATATGLLHATCAADRRKRGSKQQR
ncbi:MAG: hypothetical protein U0R51_01575 [Solirubrobacterales bacterium]